MVSITYGITLAAVSTAFLTFGFSSRALSALSLIIFPTSVATLGIDPVIEPGSYLFGY